MNTTFSAREEILTTEYRQKASFLAATWSSALRLSSQAVVASADAAGAYENRKAQAQAHADTEVSAPASQLVAQHMLLHHPGYLPVSLLREQREEKNSHTSIPTPHQASSGVSASGSADPSCVHVPSCTHCGGALQPGYMGTTVRLHSVHKAPSRTQRRRASRSKAKKMLMLTTRKKNRPAAESNLMEFCRKRQQQPQPQPHPTDSKVPRDCRNYLVVKCGMCQSPCKVPGLPRRKAGNGNDLPSTSSPKNTFPTSTSTSRAKTHKPTDVAASAVQGDDGDFVALEPVVPQGKQTQAHMPPSTQPAKRKNMNRTLLDSRKPKKKKTSDQLLNFLSSLNN
jgi:hypothetical protein